MSAYKYKVIVKGKVYGEATTLAEAEAAAKKVGGTVLQAVGKAPRKVAAKKPKASNPKPAVKSKVAAKKRNPPLEPVPAAVLLDTVRPGVPQTFHGVKVELQPVVDGKPMQRWQALAAIEAGKEGKKANPKPKAKPAAKAKPKTAKPKAAKPKAKPKAKPAAKPKKPAKTPIVYI